MRVRWLSLLCLLLGLAPTAPAQQWYSVRSNHLIGYSEGSDRGAREAAERGEELIGVFAEIFHRNEIYFATPLRVLAMHAEGRPPIVFTPAANFVTVDPAQPDSWTPAAKSIATLTLQDNYPRAQPWFDSAIASYLAGVQFHGEQMELGRPPRGMLPPANGEWIPMATLLTTSQQTPIPDAQRPIFEAESWALVRWLIDQGRMAEAGTYLNAVQWRGATPEQALSEAFSMSFADLDREVRESLRKPATKTMAAPRVEQGLVQSHKVTAEDAHVLEASLTLLGGAGGDEAERKLQGLESQELGLQELVAYMRLHQENAAVHRTLAWAFLQRGDLENAVEHIRRALTLDDSDAAMHYLYARWVNHGEENSIAVESAETRMSSELKAALLREPNYAAALELLGLAELSSGNLKAALGNLQRASALCPRRVRYQLNLARVYEAEGRMDAARNLMFYAKAGDGDDTEVSAEAAELLSKLNKQEKQRKEWAALGVQPAPNAKPSKYDRLDEAIAEDEKAEAVSKNAAARTDSRRVEFLKGRIVKVECAAATDAILTVNADGSTWRMHVADRNAAVLIGAEQFDCGWHGERVTVNYKRSGELEGEMVSLEID